MKPAYTLRLFDAPLLTFTLEQRGIEGLTAEILDCSEGQRPLFPLDLEATDEGVVRWLSRRVIPKNRAFVGEILKTLGLAANDTKGIIDVCKGLSLNDSYWVVPADFEGKAPHIAMVAKLQTDLDYLKQLLISVQNMMNQLTLKRTSLVLSDNIDNKLTERGQSSEATPALLW